jgi:hypothetical protein
VAEPSVREFAIATPPAHRRRLRTERHLPARYSQCVLDMRAVADARAGQRAARVRLGRLVYENGLSLVLMAIFAVTFVGQFLVGWRVYNQDQVAHGNLPVPAGAYLRSDHFWEATAENWESEFLQMAAYVSLTVFLFQRGSAESHAPRSSSPPRTKPRKPWPVRRGGWVLKLYEHSLSAAFLALFVVSFVAHAIAGAARYSEEQRAHGEAAVSVGQYLTMSQFWFESLQNWQSEFLAIGSMVILSIYLREKGSPESKQVDAPHSTTGK